MSLMDSLTERQIEVYGFIRDQIHGRGYGPTVREIGERFSINSPNGVMCHLKALEKKGVIGREQNSARAITLLAEREEKGLPLAGRIAAGVLHEDIGQGERIDFGEMFNGRNTFVLKVCGDSMIDDQISSGDYVVIRKQKTARDGQIVVAQTDEGEAVLKRWYVERSCIRLEPANASMRPIYVKNARILGVVIGVVRSVS